MIDGKPTPYGAQLAWSGMASLANLPATCVPVGKTAGGLLLGVQMIGPFLEDRTTIAVADMVGKLMGPLTPASPALRRVAGPRDHALFDKALEPERLQGGECRVGA